MTPLILALVLQYAAIYNISPALALAVIKVESNFKVDARSHKNAIGLMQLHRPVFESYSEKELYSVDTNIKLGMAHLAEMRDKCVHKADFTYLTCFNAGLGNAKKIKHPKDGPYYRKVMQMYEKLKGFFKRGDRVTVADCFGTHSKATINGSVVSESKEHGFEDCYVVELDEMQGMRIKVSENRLSKEK